MDDIIISNDIACDLAKIITTLCVNIQNEYDISPSLLNNLINNKEIINMFKFLYQQCYAEMINKINKFKQTFNINNDQVGDEYEKCGHLVTSHQNTYISYCNVHKYLHVPPNTNITLSNHKDNQYIDTHLFVSKNHSQVVKERYNNEIYTIYQYFINKVYIMFQQIFIYLIHNSCDQTYITVNNSTITELMNLMKSDQTIFKSKQILERFNSGTNTNTETNTETNTVTKNYYIRKFKLREGWNADFTFGI